MYLLKPDAQKIHFINTLGSYRKSTEYVLNFEQL